MSNRGMVKWQPFNAVKSGNSMIDNVLEKKNKVAMPILSEDQLYDIQNKILTAYEEKNTISIRFFRDGRYYQKDGKIVNIDSIKRKITLSDGFILYFSQIIDVFL